MSPHLSELQGAMARIPGGRYRIGSDRFYPEERPSREVTIPEFQIELAPVTNAQFASFVAATGYVTISEQPPDPQLYPNLTSDQRLPASAVFQPPAATVDRSQPMAWWAPISPGAKNSTPMASGWLTPGRANSLGPMISTMAGSGLRLLATTPPPMATASWTCAAMFGSGPALPIRCPPVSRSAGSSKADTICAPIITACVIALRQ